MTSSVKADSNIVAKRQVFYLSGFDPRGAAFYHRLYQEEAALQSKLLNVDIQTSNRSRLNKLHNRWSVKMNWRNQSQDINQDQDKQQVNTEYHFLNWDDIVREHWQPNLYKLVLESIIAYWGYIKCGAFSKIRQRYKGPFYSAIYPFLYLFLLSLFSFFVAWASALSLVAFDKPLLTAVAASTMGIISFYYGIKLGNKWGVFWLLRTYLFVFEMGLNNSRLIQDRINQFIGIIKAEQEAKPSDEVLIIGHSVGSIIAVHTASLYLQRHPELAAKVKLITLGQCIPLINGVPQAMLFNAHLTFLENQNSLNWTDFIARADSLAFCNEIQLNSNVTHQPNIQLVRFFNAFVNKRYEKIKRNKLRLHFQYLMATEKLCAYDYFMMTAGPSALSINIKNNKQ
jgi:hypothetical protein